MRRTTISPSAPSEALPLAGKTICTLALMAGGPTAAVIYTLIGTAKLCGINPQAYLRYVLERIADHHINRIDELLPWAVAQHLGRGVAQPLPLAA